MLKKNLNVYLQNVKVLGYFYIIYPNEFKNCLYYFWIKFDFFFNKNKDKTQSKLHNKRARYINTRY